MFLWKWYGVPSMQERHFPLPLEPSPLFSAICTKSIHLISPLFFFHFSTDSIFYYHHHQANAGYAERGKERYTSMFHVRNKGKRLPLGQFFRNCTRAIFWEHFIVNLHFLDLFGKLSSFWIMLLFMRLIKLTRWRGQKSFGSNKWQKENSLIYWAIEQNGTGPMVTSRKSSSRLLNGTASHHEYAC